MLDVNNPEDRRNSSVDCIAIDDFSSGGSNKSKLTAATDNDLQLSQDTLLKKKSPPKEKLIIEIDSDNDEPNPLLVELQSCETPKKRDEKF